VKPYVESNKNNFLDAEALAEAVTRQNMRLHSFSRRARQPLAFSDPRRAAGGV
jgi:hypothetical protein